MYIETGHSPKDLQNAQIINDSMSATQSTREQHGVGCLVVQKCQGGGEVKLNMGFYNNEIANILINENEWKKRRGCYEIVEIYPFYLKELWEYKFGIVSGSKGWPFCIFFLKTFISSN